MNALSTAQIFVTTLSLLLSLSLISSCSGASSNYPYTVVCPSEIRSNSRYKIITTLNNNSYSSVTFEFTVFEGARVKVSDIKRFMQPTQTASFLDIPILVPKSPPDQYTLLVKVTPEDGPTSEKRSRLSVIYADFTVFIQTDKPTYKPGDVVQYRVLVLDRNFRPFDVQQSVIIIIRDPVRNIVQSVFDAKIPPKRGMISNKLQLSPEPIIGDWTIKVYVFEKPQSASSIPSSQFYETQNTKTSDASFTETQVFTVKEYVLPKFKLNLQITPSFITVTSPKFVASVEPMYTFGKPVYGKCSFTHERSDVNNSVVVVRALNVTENSASSSLEFNSQTDLNMDLSPVSLRETPPRLRITAECEDSVSGRSYNETIDFKMYQYPYTIDLVHEREYAKRGVNHTLKLRVVSPDMKAPISEASELTVNYLGINTTLRGLSEGHISHQIFVPSNIKEDSITLRVFYKDYSKQFVLHLSSKISIDYYMKVSLDPAKTLEAPPTEGERIYLNIFSTFSLSHLNLIGLSKGDIVYNDYFTIKPQTPLEFSGENLYHSSLQVRLPRRIPPTLTLLAYTSDLTQQLVLSDVFKFIVRQTERLKVNLTVSAHSVEPGANVTITVKGLSNSVFGLRAVDESILLLKAYPDDLNEKKLFKAGQRFDFKPDNTAGTIIRYDNTQRDMINSGLLLITNIEDGHGRERTKLRKKSEELQSKSSSPTVQATKVSNFYDGAPRKRPKRERENKNNNGVVEGSALQTRLREKFPETWIWEEIDSGDGTISLVKTVPDTITSWTISAFQVNEQRGLGFSDYPGTSLGVFRSFFVSMNLPYSLVQGEILSLQVNVHNYQADDILAQITLHNENKIFEFLDSRNSTSFTKSIRLKASSVSSVIFPISVIKVGIIDIKVRARCDTAGDAISVPLIVRPIGTRYEENDAKLILVNSAREFTASLVPTFPPERVDGGDLIRVSVVGKILGGVMGNLRNLLTIPSGCGEQNMIRLVPNIVVLDYLKATGTGAESVRKEADSFLRTGYANQLNYKRHDGSFSAFGNTDPVGSTWLTAYVIRYFAEAKRYMTLDDSVIESGLVFLSKNQQADGSFQENGRVIHLELQGHTIQSSVTLTAFVLLAFQEAQKQSFTNLRNGKQTAVIISNGVNYILSESKKKKLNPYGNALVAYVLSELKNPEAGNYLDALRKNGQTNVTQRFKYWNALEEEALIGRKVVNNNAPASSSVETTGYALLALVSNGKLGESLDVVRWLLRHSNANGGFISSQDTVVGISALAKFEEETSAQKQPTKMRVEIYPDRNFGGEPLNTFYIAPNNHTVLQEFYVPSNTKEIHIKARGTGAVLAHLTWSYYVDHKNYTGTDLKLSVQPTAKPKGNMDMLVCAAVKRGNSTTNMAIIELSCPSGYEFLDDTLDDLKEEKLIKRWEQANRDNSKVTVYLDSLNINETCFTASAFRASRVSGHAKVPAKVYDYYDVRRETEISYTFIDDAPACEMCPLGRESCNENRVGCS